MKLFEMTRKYPHMNAHVLDDGEIISHAHTGDRPRLRKTTRLHTYGESSVTKLNHSYSKALRRIVQNNLNCPSECLWKNVRVEVELFKRARLRDRLR